MLEITKLHQSTVNGQLAVGIEHPSKQPLMDVLLQIPRSSDVRNNKDTMYLSIYRRYLDLVAVVGISMVHEYSLAAAFGCCFYTACCSCRTYSLG